MTIDDSLVDDRQRQLGHPQLPPELRAQCRDRGTGLRALITDLTRTSQSLTLADLDADSLPIRLRNAAARLLQPYL
jgi:hypothetical protein